MSTGKPANPSQSLLFLFLSLSFPFSCIHRDLLGTRSDRLIGRSEVALPETPDLVGLEGPHDRVEDSPVVEDDEVVLGPLVRVDQLWEGRHKETVRVTIVGGGAHGSLYLWSDSGPLHLVEQVSDLLEIGEDGTVGVQLLLLWSLKRLGEGFDDLKGRTIC
jgi:hypothetical protein